VRSARPTRADIKVWRAGLAVDGIWIALTANRARDAFAGGRDRPGWIKVDKSGPSGRIGLPMGDHPMIFQAIDRFPGVGFPAPPGLLGHGRAHVPACWPEARSTQFGAVAQSRPAITQIQDQRRGAQARGLMRPPSRDPGSLLMGLAQFFSR